MSDAPLKLAQSKSPFQVSRAPGYERDSDDKMTMNYLAQRGEEERSYVDKLRLIGDLDKLEPQLIEIFKKITEMRGFIDDVSKRPLMSDGHKKILLKITKNLDKINKYIAISMIKDLDNLGMES